MSSSSDDGLQCTEFSHSFLDHSSSYIVGYKCDSTALFIAIVLSAFFLVIGQNVLATKDGQASRQALLTKKGSAARKRIIWKLLWYTFLSSLLGTIHVLLVIGANIYILIALLLGNLAGVFWSYREQEADEHDSSADLQAVLRLAKEHPEDKKWLQLRKEMLIFLCLPTKQQTSSKQVSPMQLDFDSTPSATTRNRRGPQFPEFAPYSDRPIHHNLEL